MYGGRQRNQSFIDFDKNWQGTDESEWQEEEESWFPWQKEDEDEDNPF
jgi:hypothetical protein